MVKTLHLCFASFTSCVSFHYSDRQTHTSLLINYSHWPVGEEKETTPEVTFQRKCDYRVGPQMLEICRCEIGFWGLEIFDHPMSLKKKCSYWDFRSDLLISVKTKRKYQKNTCVFVPHVVHEAASIHDPQMSDKTLLWGKQWRQDIVCWKPGFKVLPQNGQVYVMIPHHLHS